MRQKMTRIMLPAILIALVLTGLACNDQQEPQETTSTTTTEAAETTTEETTQTQEEVTEPTDEDERIAMNIGALRGPTGIGLANLMQAQAEGETSHDYNFTLAAAPDEIVAGLTSGQLDIAALPTNLAAVLYQRTSGNVRMLAVNTLGVLYILERGDSVQSVQDLAGKTIEASGQAAVPEYAINYILAQNELSDEVTIEYRSEHAELATRAIAGQADLVMLPEPFVTTVLRSDANFRVALDLTQEWQAVQEEGQSSELAMGCLVVSADFAAANPQALASFLAEYKLSAQAANEDPQGTGVLVEQFGIMPDGDLAAQAIPNSNIVSLTGSEMQPILEPFYQVLLEQNPQSIGGELPPQDFYVMP